MASQDPAGAFYPDIAESGQISGFLTTLVLITAYLGLNLKRFTDEYAVWIVTGMQT